jgi:hypothetical protein
MRCPANGARNQSQHQQDDCPNQIGYVSGSYDSDYPDNYLSQRPDGAAEKAKQRDVTENADARAALLRLLAFKAYRSNYNAAAQTWSRLSNNGDSGSLSCPGNCQRSLHNLLQETQTLSRNLICV